MLTLIGEVLFYQQQFSFMLPRHQLMATSGDLFMQGWEEKFGSDKC